MQQRLTDDKSIYLQISQMIETDILRGILLEEERMPSTNELAKLYTINPATAAKGINLLRLVLAFLPPVVLGSLLYQSAMLSWFYFKGSRGSFLQGYWFYLSTRGVQFAIVIILDVLIIYLLFRTNLFRRVGLWPLPEKNKKSGNFSRREILKYK